MFRVRPLALASVAAVCLVAGSALALTPANATTLDASGVALDFSNPTDTNYLANAGLGDRQLYEGVATIGGTVVDAVVTLVGASDTSVGVEEFQNLNLNQVGLLNELLPGGADPLTAGCYSNDAYVANPYAYVLGDFRLSDLLVGERVTFVDEYDDDPAYNSTINSGVDLCVDSEDGDGDITVRVDFQVDGSPVTLTNVALHITDLDNQQEMVLSAPKPSSWTIDGESVVTVSEAEADVLTFVGSVDPSPYEEPKYPERYTAEARYDSVSSLTYSFKIVDASSGGVEVAFDTFFESATPPAVPAAALAETGSNAWPAGMLALGALGVGGVLLMTRRGRRHLA
jgi:hypothetical protein